MEKLIQKIYEQARALGACGLFTGKEKTIEKMIELFFSPQGMEFCIRNHFPNLTTFRELKAYKLDRFGIYVDAGSIFLKNPRKAILVGKTSATIDCDTVESHEVVLLHSAQAVVNASGWAVVVPTVQKGCQIIRNASEHAIILR